jgi:hypothetical protein
LPTYEKKRPNSIIDLSKNILKDKYLGPLGFSSYRDKVSAIGFGTYYEILNLIVGSLNADAERKLLSDAEKKQSLRILEFFNGVPEPLVNYYDEEGEFLADWLQSNCL